MFKKTVSVILALALILSMPISAFGKNRKFQLVVLGDSATNGYGLRGYANDKIYNWTGTDEEYYNWENKGTEADTWNPHNRMLFNLSGYRNEIDGSTAMDIAKLLKARGLDVEIQQLALSGSRIEELRIFLDNSYNGDAYTVSRMNDIKDWLDSVGGIDALRNDYKHQLKMLIWLLLIWATIISEHI